jgi:hypothetical protein
MGSGIHTVLAVAVATSATQLKKSLALKLTSDLLQVVNYRDYISLALSFLINGISRVLPMQYTVLPLIIATFIYFSKED